MAALVAILTLFGQLHLYVYYIIYVYTPAYSGDWRAVYRDSVDRQSRSSIDHGANSNPANPK